MSKYLAPGYLIIGGVKCGSSSLYRYLNFHPHVLPCKSKEPNYFSFRPWYQIPFTYARYRKMFPLKNQVGKLEADWLDLGADGKMHASTFSKVIEANQTYITGEATATTFFGAKPRIVKFLLPKVRLIMILRDPTERYVSHYRMYERFKAEGRKGYDFEPLEKYIEDEISLHEAGKKTRILHQGLYSKYLEKWAQVFGRENLLLLRTQDFEEISSAQQQMVKLCGFLDLPSHDFKEILSQKYNRANPEVIPEKVRNVLDQFYASSQQELAQNFDIDFHK